MALAVSIAGATVAVGQTDIAATQPAVVAPAAAPSAYAGAEIRRTGANVDAPKSSKTAEESATTSQPASGLDTTRIIFSLVVVLGLIFGLKFFGQKWFNPITAKSSNRTVETLSRAIIGPKQQILLIRVGKRRVIVVGDSGGKLSQLDQITDADEIAELVGQLHTDKLGPAASAFAGMFGRNTEKFAAVEAESDADETVDKETVDAAVSSTQRDLESLLSKVRRVSGKMG
jgi:flagellar biogenesis protein FliO